MGWNPAVSGVISRKVILAAGPIPNTLWRGLAQCFDLNKFIDSMEDDMPLSPQNAYYWCNKISPIFKYNILLITLPNIQGVKILLPDCEDMVNWSIVVGG